MKSISRLKMKTPKLLHNSPIPTPSPYTCTNNYIKNIFTVNIQSREAVLEHLTKDKTAKSDDVNVQNHHDRLFSFHNKIVLWN